MITKKMYATCIIRNFCKNNHIPVDTDPKDLVGKIYLSSSLAVALQVLGYLDDNEEANTYASSRGSMLITCHDNETNKINFLTRREVFSMLPDSLLTMRPYKIIYANNESKIFFVHNFDDLFNNHYFMNHLPNGIIGILTEGFDVPLEERFVYVDDDDITVDKNEHKQLIKEIKKNKSDTGVVSIDVTNVGTSTFEYKIDGDYYIRLCTIK